MALVKKISSDIFEVPSFREDATYIVSDADNRCTCPVSNDRRPLRLVHAFEGNALLAS